MEDKRGLGASNRKAEKEFEGAEAPRYDFDEDQKGREEGRPRETALPHHIFF